MNNLSSNIFMSQIREINSLIYTNEYTLMSPISCKIIFDMCNDREQKFYTLPIVYYIYEELDFVKAYEEQLRIMDPENSYAVLKYKAYEYANTQSGHIKDNLIKFYAYLTRHTMGVRIPEPIGMYLFDNPEIDIDILSVNYIELIIKIYTERKEELIADGLTLNYIASVMESVHSVLDIHTHLNFTISFHHRCKHTFGRIKKINYADRLNMLIRNQKIGVSYGTVCSIGSMNPISEESIRIAKICDTLGCKILFRIKCKNRYLVHVKTCDPEIMHREGFIKSSYIELSGKPNNLWILPTPIQGIGYYRNTMQTHEIYVHIHECSPNQEIQINLMAKLYRDPVSGGIIKRANNYSFFVNDENLKLFMEIMFFNASRKIHYSLRQQLLGDELEL